MATSHVRVLCVVACGLSPDFADETEMLSHAAFRLYLGGLIWSSKKSTDRKLLKVDMPMWALCLDGVGELVRENFWEDHGEYYLVLRYRNGSRVPPFLQGY